MKKSEIKAALVQLKRIKMPKIEDKDLRNDIISNHFVLLDAGKKTDAAIEAKRTVFLEAYKDEEQAVAELQTKINEAASREEQIALTKELREKHADYLQAVKDFNEDVDKMFAEQVDGLKPIAREKFMAEIEKQDFDLAMVEGLYPMFVIK